jgi:hypothetical protein
MVFTMRSLKQIALKISRCNGSFGIPQKYGLPSRGAARRQTSESTETWSEQCEA